MIYVHSSGLPYPPLSLSACLAKRGYDDFGTRGRVFRETGRGPFSLGESIEKGMALRSGLEYLTISSLCLFPLIRKVIYDVKAYSVSDSVPSSEQG